MGGTERVEGGKNDQDKRIDKDLKEKNHVPSLKS